MFQRMMFNVLLWVFDTEAGAVFTLQSPILELVGPGAQCFSFVKARHVYNTIQGAIHCTCRKTAVYIIFIRLIYKYSIAYVYKCYISRAMTLSFNFPMCDLNSNLQLPKWILLS